MRRRRQNLEFTGPRRHCRLHFSPKGLVENRGHEGIQFCRGFSLQGLQRIYLFLHVVQIGDNPALLRERRNWNRHSAKVVQVELCQPKANLLPSPVASLAAAELVLPLRASQIGVEVVWVDDVGVRASDSDVSIGVSIAYASEIRTGDHDRIRGTGRRWRN